MRVNEPIPTGAKAAKVLGWLLVTRYGLIAHFCRWNVNQPCTAHYAGRTASEQQVRGGGAHRATLYTAHSDADDR